MCVRFLVSLALVAIILNCDLAAQSPQPARPIYNPQIKVRDPYNVLGNRNVNPVAPAPKLGTPPRHPQAPPPFDPWDLLRLAFPDPASNPAGGQPGSSYPSASAPPPRPAEPPEPSAEQIAQLTNDQILTLLIGATDYLDAELDRLKTGDAWKKHLQLATVQKALSDAAIGDVVGSDALGSISVEPSASWQMDPNTRELLQKISISFLEVAAEPKYSKISSLRGFRTVQRGLREYSLPPAERQAHVLSAIVPILIESLDRERTGAAWKTFLKVEDVKQLAESSEEWSQGDLDRATEILGQFEKIRENPQYAVVAQMPGFEATYGALNAFVQGLEEELVGSLPLPPPPVSLPPPPSE